MRTILPIISLIVRGLPLFALTAVASCSIIQPDHLFKVKTPHSWDFGSGQLDTLAVYAILAANDIPAEKFSAITRTDATWRIYYLDLSHLNIDTLPKEICSMGALRYLNLSYNNVSVLPDSIVKLRIYTSYTTGGGPCGSADCSYMVTTNHLSIDHNRLCDVPGGVAAWIDKQFGRTGYLAGDTTQNCAALQ